MVERFRFYAPKPPDFAFNENTDLNEEMKKRMSDDQFVAATNAIADLRARLTAKAKGRMDFLSSVDASKMSAADREKHEKYLNRTSSGRGVVVFAAGRSDVT